MAAAFNRTPGLKKIHFPLVQTEWINIVTGDVCKSVHPGGGDGGLVILCKLALTAEHVVDVLTAFPDAPLSKDLVRRTVSAMRAKQPKASMSVTRLRRQMLLWNPLTFKTVKVLVEPVQQRSSLSARLVLFKVRSLRK